jgi:short-subunit dehydrogenase
MKGNELNGRWAVVTGASSGIGQAFARELVRRGWKVLAVARRQDRLQTLASEAAERGRNIVPLVADLGTSEGVALVTDHMAKLERVDLLINNAGMVTPGDFCQSQLEKNLASIQLNVDAVVSLTHAALDGMLLRRTGAIINLASVVAFQPFPHFALYAAGKAFVLSFTEAVAAEVKGSGVRILALCPGAAKTEMSAFSQNQGWLGKLPILGADEIVRVALTALDRGRVVKTVGWLNRMLVFFNRFLPRATVRWIMGNIVKEKPSPVCSPSQI